MKLAQRTRRIGWAILAMLVAALAILPVGASASAAATITSEPYTSAMHIDGMHAAGYDGAGVRIALIDSRVDTTVPELKGASIKVVDSCHPTGKFAAVPHATGMASILVSPIYGIAPKATLTDYVMTEGDALTAPGKCSSPAAAEAGWLLNQALNDGADVVVITSVQTGGYWFGYAVSRAAVMGVPVIVGAGNDSKQLNVVNLASTNGTVGVSSVDMNGRLSDFSNFGKGITIAAPGEQFRMRDADSAGRLTKIVTTKGTSVATAIVGGLMALVRQAHPGANGNQLLASLVHNGYGTNGKWTANWGWGIVNAGQMINDTVSSYPTTNPLLDKFPGAWPKPKEYQDYAAGLADPANLLNDPHYVYRGTDPIIIKQWKNSQPGTTPTPAVTSSASASSSASPSPSSAARSTAASATGTPSPAPQTGGTGSTRAVRLGWILGGVALAAAGVLGVLALRRRGGQSTPTSG